jgi:hypothetical protein
MSLLKRIPSAAQLSAARTNGAKSKGPVTPQGKRNSSANSRRYPDYFAIVNTLTAAEIREHANLITELTAEYPPRTPAEQRLIEIVARERIYQLHYWRFETAIINANQPCPGILCRLSRLEYACSKRLVAALTALADGRPATQNTKTPERTVYIHEKEQNSTKTRTEREPNCQHFRSKLSRRKTPRPVPAILMPLKTRTNRA